MNTKILNLFQRTASFLIFLPALLCISCTLYGQASARDVALAKSTVAGHGFWNVFGNPAGLAGLNTLAAGVSAGNRYLIKELQQTGMAVAFGGKPGITAISYARSGVSLYSVNRVGLSYSRKFLEKYSAGIELHYTYELCGPEKKASHSGNVNLGFIYRPPGKCSFGFHLGNPGSMLIRENFSSLETPFFRLGMVFEESQKLHMFLEAEKALSQQPQWKCGLEIIPCEKFSIRTGLSFPPFSMAFGAGMAYQSLIVDIAAMYHHILGFSPQLSIKYAFRQWEK